MRIIISPAKKMAADTDSLAADGLPALLERTERLKAVLQEMSPAELQALWKCNDAIAKRNVERLSAMDLRRRLTPAILSYEGIQYQYMAPRVMETAQLDYLQEHLRILSGFYGLLRPFDGVTPYRLEMQARLSVGETKDLYAFWGDRLYRELVREDRVILNLASREYSKAIEPYLKPEIRYVTCIFGSLKDGKIKVKGTEAKMARGEMVRWLSEQQIEEPEDVREFDGLGFSYCAERSAKGEYVFVKKG